MVNFVLIALACGWTLIDADSLAPAKGFAADVMGAFQDPAKILKHINLSSVLVIALTSAYFFIEVFDVLTTSKEHDFNKFHDHESSAGTTLLLFQVLLCAIFAFSLFRTEKEVKSRLKTFVRRLALSGCLWFLSTPVLCAVAVGTAKVSRHRLVTGGTLFVQTLALLTMCQLFLTRSNEYFKLSPVMSQVGLIAPASSPRVAGKSID